MEFLSEETAPKDLEIPRPITPSVFINKSITEGLQGRFLSRKTLYPAGSGGAEGKPEYSIYSSHQRSDCSVLVRKHTSRMPAFFMRLVKHLFHFGYRI